MDLPAFTSDKFGLLFPSSMTIIIVALMLFMSYRLNGRNRRQAYRSLLISLFLILIHNLHALAFALGLTPQSPYLAFGAKLLQVYAFVMINFAIFELYHRQRARTRLWFYGLLTAGLLVAGGDLLPHALNGGPDWAASLHSTPALDTYLLLLVPLFSVMFAPHIGQPRKYIASLSIAFAMHMSSIAGTYWMPESPFFATLTGLLPVVYYILLFMLLFERVVEVMQSVYRSSITDGLTNLYNRRYFTGKLEQMVGSGRPVGVIFCDIDNFKRLNDTHGHLKADGVLKQVAAILAEETDGVGLAGRYGGEELVAFVVGDSSLLRKTAENIRLRTEKECIVTVSVGFSAALPGVSAEKLLKQADTAMYYSKTNGKNRVTEYAKLKGALNRHA